MLNKLNNLLDKLKIIDIIQLEYEKSREFFSEIGV
jgi:hypothetical protein